jgi:alcohol dehydrogenase class IV
MESSNFPLFGLWQPGLSQLKHLYYGAACVQKHLLSTLPTPSSKVLVLTGRSIATKTPFLQQLETLLGSHHAGTFSQIRQHAPVADINQATEVVERDPAIDTILSLGGGSPIDAAKVISLRAHERSGKFLTHLTIPTTLSAAECTEGAGYTRSDGVKASAHNVQLGVTAIFYDPDYVKYTPTQLLLATGMRAMDHAVESLYNQYATEMPWKALSIWAVEALFENLPRIKGSHPNDGDVVIKLLLAAFASLGFLGYNVKGGLGLSHSIGYALGSPYGIPRESPNFFESRMHWLRLLTHPQMAKPVVSALAML